MSRDVAVEDTPRLLGDFRAMLTTPCSLWDPMSHTRGKSWTRLDLEMTWETTSPLAFRNSLLELS